MSLLTDSLIAADWPAPATVRALTTTRLGGFSERPYDSFNLGTHVSDDPAAVLQNRQLLQQWVNEIEQQVQPATDVQLQWLQQVHGCDVVEARADGQVPTADAAVTTTPQHACLVMTADCLPVLLCDRQGRQVAAAHAGWRGLLGEDGSGVLEATVATFTQPGEQLLAWLGPAIGPQAFEVGDDVYQAFCATDAGADACFKAGAQRGKWLADIYALARMRLAKVGVDAVFGGNYCTYSQAERFFSYRRDGQTGRMASLIWLT